MTGPDYRAARVAAGLTVADVARALGMRSCLAIHRYEDGDRELQPAQVARLVAVLK